MKKILLFGASGNLGKAIAKEASQQDYELTVVVRNKNKANELASLTRHAVIADVTDPSALNNICKGYDVVISALGKSVSPNDKSKPSFHAVDLVANTSILEEAKKSGVQKFVYVSALHSKRYLHLNYFKVHHAFSEKLKQSGLNYSIIKPPAIFSAFIDMIQMAKKGQLVTIGDGSKTTNPIYEGDLAKVCVNSIQQDNCIIEAGGKKTYTRKQLNEIIQQEVNPDKKVRTVPAGLMKLSLPMLKLFNKNTYDKFAFFTEVMQHDTIAPPMGDMGFEEYIRMKKTVA